MSPGGSDDELRLAMDPVPGDAFTGEVRIDHVRWVSEDGTFAVVGAILQDGSEIAVVGPLGHIEEDERVQVTGTFEEHRRHGIQIAATEAVPLDPSDSDGARAYLETIPGIGPARADALIARFGEKVFEGIDADPESAFATLKGVSKERAAEAAEDWRERRSQRRLYSLLAPHGLARFTAELIGIHGSGAYEAVQDDPYALTELSGVGFHSADRLAQGIGVAADSPRRIEAAAEHALREAEDDGHTHLPIQELIGAMRALLGSDAEPSIGRVTANPDLVVEGTDIYRAWTHEAERWLGATLAGMARSEPAWNRPPLPAETEGLTPEQTDATANAMSRRLSVITGGPGTGKTHLTAAIVRMAASRDIDIKLLAPTGRAARRLAETTGAEASTIHKELEWIPGDFPGKDESNPIDADLVVVDESSMLSLEICRHLIAAIAHDSHLVLIGDADQLPPVGPGKPFCELIESAIVPTVRLGHVFRQARQSMIVGAAHEIRNGREPRGEPREEEIHDFYTHNRSVAEDLAHNVIEMATKRIPDRWELDPVREIQVLAPQYKGAAGIDALHRRMREVLCKGQRELLEGRFQVGEKVILTRSLPELDVSNGSMFVIADADDTRSVLMLENDVGQMLEFPYHQARSLRGGFCTSVHKAQGFEIPAVIVCIHSSHAPQLLSRNLVYTAVTRARQLCVLAGDRRAIRRAISNTDAMRRHSRLKERLLA